MSESGILIPVAHAETTHQRNRLMLRLAHWQGETSAFVILALASKWDYLHSLFLYHTFQSNQFLHQSVIHRMGLSELFIESFIDSSLLGSLILSQVREPSLYLILPLLMIVNQVQIRCRFWFRALSSRLRLWTRWCLKGSMDRSLKILVFIIIFLCCCTSLNLSWRFLRL